MTENRINKERLLAAAEAAKNKRKWEQMRLMLRYLWDLIERERILKNAETAANKKQWEEMRTYLFEFVEKEELISAANAAAHTKRIEEMQTYLCRFMDRELELRKGVRTVGTKDQGAKGSGTVGRDGGYDNRSKPRR